MSESATRVGARRLLDMCMAKIADNIRFLDDIGTTPISLAVRILKLVERADQLALLEQNSPHLISHTSAIWFNFIKRDFVDWQKYLLIAPQPKGKSYTIEEARAKCSSRVYEKCRRLDQAANEAAEEQLRKQMQAHNDALVKRETRILERMPMIIRRRGVAPASSVRFTPGKSNTPQAIMHKVRREVADLRARRPGSTLATPTHLLNTNGSNRARMIRAPGRLLSEARPLMSGQRPVATAPKRVNPSLAPPLPVAEEAATTALNVDTPDTSALDIIHAPATTPTVNTASAPASADELQVPPEIKVAPSPSPLKKRRQTPILRPMKRYKM